MTGLFGKPAGQLRGTLFQMGNGSELGAEPRPGLKVLERFVVGSQIAVGGSSRVFRGTDLVPKEGSPDQVAIKFLREDLADSEEMRHRFLRESKHAARAQHPRLCRLLKSGWCGPAPVLVMELLHGTLLGARIESGALPASEAVQIARAVLLGLSSLHQLGVVHRDVKPGNIMCVRGRPGEAKLFDFGTACFDRARARLRESLTPVGRAMGTPGYASPEQCRGGPVEGLADIYSLGVVLWETLTGREFLPQHATSGLTGIAPPLQTVVRKALEREPADRFCSALEMAEALEKLEL